MNNSEKLESVYDLCSHGWRPSSNVGRVEFDSVM